MAARRGAVYVGVTVTRALDAPEEDATPLPLPRPERKAEPRADDTGVDADETDSCNGSRFRVSLVLEDAEEHALSNS